MVRFKPFPALDTPRLHLRQLLHKDAPALLALRSDDIVNKYIDRPPTITIEDAKAFIEKINTLIANNESIYWILCLKDQTDLIGTICLWNFSEDQTQAEIGYELVPAFHGKGLMNEALQAVLNYARAQLHLKKISAYTHRDNISSTSLLKKNNFEVVTGKTDEENKNNIILELSFA